MLYFFQLKCYSEKGSVGFTRLLRGFIQEEVRMPD